MPLIQTNDNGSIGITSTSFFGLIDYDVLADRHAGSDYERVSAYFPDFSRAEQLAERPWKFLLTKLLVRERAANSIEVQAGITVKVDFTNAPLFVLHDRECP
ncbi:MAG TPA: hypothetical protein DCK93_02385 [Blastocatellia bacterium]|jgi:hypothetical protein|nr:hypothetical protein [Blastocatellia bacterium]HAF21752.1 hypothetical protein [Blastocatellia bacterium]